MMVRMLSLVMIAFSATSLLGQVPDAPPEMKVYKQDVGTWDCSVKFYYDPSAEPVESKATEVNRMVGEMWAVSEFKGEIMGAPFHGAAQMGYDPVKKKYVSQWIDSMSPFAIQMEGTYDEKTKTLTSFGKMKDPAGAEMDGKWVVVYKNENERSMTMSSKPDGAKDFVVMMEVQYKRSADKAK